MQIRVYNKYLQLVNYSYELGDLIYSYFEYYVPGAHFSKNFGKKEDGKWDGFVSFFTKSKLATGFLPLLIEYLDELKEEYTIKDFREQRLEYKKYIPQSYVLRKYQNKAVIKANQVVGGIQFIRGICNAATNSGKNYMISSFIGSFNAEFNLVLIHSLLVFKQLYAHLLEEFGEDKVGRVYDKFNDIDKPIVVGMYKTVESRANKSMQMKDYLNKIGLTVVDESHRALAKDFMTLISRIDSPGIIFCSGTAIEFKDFSKKLQAISLSGPVFYKMSNKKLMDMDVSARLTIYIDKNNIGEDRYNYKSNYLYNVQLSPNRAKKITQFIIDNPGKTLITVINYKHGDYLQAYLKAEGFNAIFISGKSSNIDEVVQDFKDGKITILISTTILKEGVNIPNFVNLILAHGQKSKISIKQWIGRLLRNNDYKKEFGAKMLDFYDDFQTLNDHSDLRINLYKREKFEINFLY